MYIGLSMMGKESKVEVFMYNLHIISYSVELCSDRDKLQSHSTHSPLRLLYMVGGLTLVPVHHFYSSHTATNMQVVHCMVS